MKTCSKCGIEKDIGEFYVRRSRANGTMPNCKRCSAELARLYYTDKKEHINVINAKWKLENSDKHKEINAKWRKENAERHRESGRQWAFANKGRRKETSDRWYRENIEIRTASIIAWKSINPDLVKKYRAVSREKTMSTPSGRLNSSMTSSICSALRGVKGGRRWESLVGYSVHELKSHLEKMFSVGMDWSNYGVIWEIDHKIPKSVFNYQKAEDLDFKLAWDLKNLRPLYVSENRRKYNKIESPFQPSLLLSVNANV